MKRKTAVELYEARFPVRASWLSQSKTIVLDLTLGFAEPTLDELIGACGEAFSSLKRTDGRWVAVASVFMNTTEREHGESAKEAVAKLWLKLQRGGFIRSTAPATEQEVFG